MPSASRNWCFTTILPNNVVSGEEADECTLGLVKAFDNGFFAFQFFRLQIAAHFLLKFTRRSSESLTIMPRIVSRLVVMLIN
jgi:hypothetical protein